MLKIPKGVGTKGTHTGTVAIDKVSSTSSIRNPVTVDIKTPIHGGSGAGNLRDHDVAAACKLDVAALEDVAVFESG